MAPHTHTEGSLFRPDPSSSFLRSEFTCAICSRPRGMTRFEEPDRHRAWICPDCIHKLYQRSTARASVPAIDSNARVLSCSGPAARTAE